MLVNELGKIEAGLYCCGWAKTGSVGELATTLADARQTADSVLKDLDSLPSIVEAGGIEGYLKDRNITFVNGRKWLQLNETEIKKGEALEKPRFKFSNYFDMFAELNRISY